MEKDKNTKGGADRYNQGKTQWSLVDFQSIESLPKVLAYGAKKYARDNWKKGQSINSQIDCMMRHLVAFKDGQTLDSESGESHIGHIMCNAMFIEYTLKNHPELDDRAK